MLRILIVDDSPDDRAEVRRQLLHSSQHRYEIEERGTGQGVVELVHGEKRGLPDCIILDYNLADTDAPDLLVRLCDANGQTLCPIVVITGGVGASAGRSVLRAGAQDYIGKEWLTPAGLNRAIENAMERWSLDRELKARESTLARKNAGLLLISELAEMLVAADDPNETIHTLLERSAEFLNAEIFMLHSLVNGSDEGSHLLLSAARGLTDVTRESVARLGSGHTLCWAAIRQRGLVNVENMETSAQSDNTFEKALGIRAYVCHPMLAMDRILGTLCFASTTKASFDQDELEFIQAVGNHVAAAHERGRRQLELKASERFALQVLESSPDCVMVLDSQTRLQWMNANGLRLLNIEKFLSIQQHDWIHFWHAGEGTESSARALATARNGGVGRMSGPGPVVHGQVHWWDVTITLISGIDSAQKDLLCVARDMTERNQMEQALLDQDRRKDEFLATLAHELRNPLAPLRTGLFIMKHSPEGDPAIEKSREIMERQLQHMVRLIDDLLDVSRITSGKVELKKERVLLRSVIDHALEVSAPLMKRATHTLDVLLPEQPVWMFGDLTRLTQIISNLLNNAAKYTPNTGHIEISAVVDAGEIVIRVSDNGAGIAPEMLPKVFDMFRQVELTRDRAQGGLGIGLSLVRGFTVMHDGSVTASSDGLGKGSTFTVRLPLATVAITREHTSSVQDSLPVTRRRVLVVDDNVDGADSLAMMLQLSGHDTRTAYDGPDALTITSAFQPDVVFLDIGLPHMNGFEVARRIRKDTRVPSIVLIALTGWGSDEDKQRTTDAGFDFHLTKPVDALAVGNILAELSH